MAFLLLFIFSFPDKNRLKPIHYFIILFLPFIFFIISFTPLLVQKVDSANSFHISGTLGPAFLFYRFFVVAYILSILVIPIKKIFKFGGEDKLRIKYVILGIGSFIIPALITNAILPGFFNIRELNFLGPLFSVFTVIFISYSITKHRLMDVTPIIQRGVIFSALTFIIIAVYLLFVFVFGHFFSSVFGIHFTFYDSDILTILIGIFGVPPLERAFKKATDKFFYKDKYDYSLALHELSEILNKNLDLNALMGKSIQKLKAIFKINKILILLYGQNIYSDGNKTYKIRTRQAMEFINGLKNYRDVLIRSEIPYLLKNIKDAKAKRFFLNAEKVGNENEMEISVPIFLKEKLIGLIAAGEKKSGEEFTREDVNLLKTFANHAAVAFEKAVLYEKEKIYARELEKRVQERTKKIKDLQEEQKQIMLEISHGLQTPLTIIKSEVSMLKKRFPQDEKIFSFENSLDKISKFIYDMLVLAKLDSGKEKIKKEPTDLSELVEDLVEYFQIIVKDKKIKIIKQIEPSIFIAGAKDKLEETIINLVSNSIKYMNDKERKILIGLKRKMNEAELVIEDTGIGMDKEDLKNIFTKFYRVKDEKIKGVKGTGLGLAIAKKIVEIHGGKIKAESEKGKGTKMIINFKALGSKRTELSKREVTRVDYGAF